MKLDKIVQILNPVVARSWAPIVSMHTPKVHTHEIFGSITWTFHIKPLEKNLAQSRYSELANSSIEARYTVMESYPILFIHLTESNNYTY